MNPPATPLFNPFPGLRPFRSDERHLFFGREDQIGELLKRLRESRFLAVVGPSGSGKSSLVRAGLLPELHGGTMASAGSHWEVLVARPGGDPLTNLATALVEADLYDREEPGIIDQVRTTLDRSALGLVEAIRQSDLDPGTNTLLVIDQFEELFRFRGQGGQSTEEASAFVKLLLEAGRAESARIYVVLTMRSDYLGECAQFRGLAEAVNEGEYLIPRLTRAQRRSAIAGPVRVGGARISQRLLTKLLNDVGDDPDQLPVLQHALMRTWECWARDHAEGEEVDLRHYEATGGMAEALSRHADEVHDSLGDDESRRLSERVFKALTEKIDEHRGIRRPMRLDRLAAVADAPEDRIAGIVDAFRAPGCTFLMPPDDVELASGTVIDISHESLMRVWERLRRWVDDEAQSAGIYRRLAETAELHAGGRAGLYHDPDLAVAQAWRRESAPNAAWADLYGGGFEHAIGFLETSRETAQTEEREREAARQRELEQARQLAETRERAARNFKRFAVGMGVVALAALGAFVFALQKQREADGLRREAVEQSARTDIILGNNFVEQGNVGRGLAHLARAVEPEAKPDSPEVVDRIFNLLAYTAPPGYRSPPLDYGERSSGHRPLTSSDATPDGALVATTSALAWNRFLLWTQGSSTPIRQNSTGGATWLSAGSLAFSPDGSRLMIGRGGRNGRAELYDVARWSQRWEMPHDVPAAPEFSVKGDRCLTVKGSGGYHYAEIRDTESGELIRTLGPWLCESSITWSPDESHLALPPPSDATIVGIADAETGKVVAEFTHDHPVLAESLKFSPDGRRLLTSTYEAGGGIVWAWSLDEPDKAPVQLAHDPSAKSGFRDGDVFAYFGEGGAFENDDFVADPTPGRGSVFAIGAFTPDGQHIITVGTDLTARLWDASPEPMDPADREIHSWKIRDQFAWYCPPTFSTDGRRFMIPTRDYGCYVGALEPPGEPLSEELARLTYVNEGYAHLANPGEIKPLLIPQGQVVGGAVHPDGTVIALGTLQGQVRLFDLRTGEAVGPPLEHPEAVSEVAFSRDGSRIVTRSRRLGVLRIWDATSPGTLLFSSENGENPGLMSDVDADARLLYREGELTASPDGELILTEHGLVTDRSGRVVTKLEPPTGAGLATFGRAAFSRDGTLVATVPIGGNRIDVWSTASGEQLHALPSHESIISTLEFHPDGERLAAGCDSGKVYLWRIRSGEGPEFSGSWSCRRIAFSADGRLLAAVFRDVTAGAEVAVWDTETSQPIAGPLECPSGVSDLAFVDGGTRLATWSQRFVGTTPGIALVWDVSVSGGEPAPPWFLEIATSFGGSRLDELSVPKTVRERAFPPEDGLDTEAQRRLARFFQWLHDFPGTRPDSPFRPAVTDAYIDALIDQTDFALLDEAVRLRPRDPRALVRRAALRPLGATDEGARVLTSIDLTRAQLLAPDDPEVALFASIGWEAAGWPGKADAAFERAAALGSTPLDSLLAAVAIQEHHDSRATRESPRRRLLDLAIAAAEQPPTRNPKIAGQLRIKRFLLSITNEDLAAARDEWEAVRAFDEFPEDHDPAALLDRYLELAESKARALVDESGDWESAIRALKPVALVAELAKSFRGEDLEEPNYWAPSSALSRLVEWENRQSLPTTLVPEDAVWKYLDDGTDQGTAWREPEFDDSSWNEGPAKLGYGGDGETTKVRRNETDDRDLPAHVTTYFRHAFEVDESVRKPYFAIDVVRDDGVIVYLNGVEVARDAMPPGEVTYDDWASETAGQSGSNPDELREHRFLIDGRQLRAGRNVLAAEIHQVEPDSTDIGFQLHLFGIDHAPGPFFRALLEDEVDGVPLRSEAMALVPKPLRDEWQAALEAVLAAATGSTIPPDGLTQGASAAVFRLQGMMGDWERSRTTAERALEEIGPIEAPSTVVAARPWMLRNAIALERLGRTAEAQAMQRATWVPPRNPELDSRLLDLGEHFNVGFHDPDWHQGARDDYSDLAATYQPRDGVAYDLRGGVLMGIGVRTDIRGLPVGREAKAIYFLASAVRGDVEPDGTALAHVTVHYADGRTAEEFPIVLGEDVVDWNPANLPATPTSPRSRVAWQGPKPGDHRTLNEIVWKNPHPDATIASLDITSEKVGAALLLLGITLK